MFGNILVAFDGSSYSQKALKVAFDIVKLSRTELTIIHVVPDAPPYADDLYGKTAEESSYLEFLENHGKQIIDMAHHMAEAEKIRANTLLLHGNPVNEILKYIDKSGISLIIMGNRGTTPNQMFNLGSISDRVAHATKCSVLIVK